MVGTNFSKFRFDVCNCKSADVDSWMMTLNLKKREGTPTKAEDENEDNPHPRATSIFAVFGPKHL